MEWKILNQHGSKIPKQYVQETKDFLHNGQESAVIFGHKVTVIQDHRKDNSRVTKVNVEYIG